MLGLKEHYLAFESIPRSAVAVVVRASFRAEHLDRRNSKYCAAQGKALAAESNGKVTDQVAREGAGKCFGYQRLHEAEVGSNVDSRIIAGTIPTGNELTKSYKC